VAPDYLDLMLRAEDEYDFAAAGQALDTALAFDPALADGWHYKGLMLLSQRRFDEAWTILSGAHGRPVKKDPPAIRLADKYRTGGPVTDAGLPQLVKDFQRYGLAEGIPRLFYHLNREPFDPQTRFPAVAEALAIQNPEVESLNFNWQVMGPAGWIMDVGNNPALNDLSPLCGLKILILNASLTGTPDLRAVTEPGLLELRLSGTRLNRLPERPQLSGVKVLDISKTRIRDIAPILKYSRLSTLDISGIEELTVSPQLVWLQNLRMLTISEALFNDPTILALTRRGVIIIYSEE
jgi:hypothetical protein